MGTDVISGAWELAPTILVALIFWFVMRAVVRADRNERSAYAKIEAEERAKLSARSGNPS